MNISLDKGNMLVELDRPSPQIKDELGARKHNGNVVKLAPITLNVQRLVELFGENILDDAPEIIADLYTEEWGFRGFSDEERARAEAHPRWGDLYEWQREGVEYLFCNPHGASLLQFGPRLGKAVVTAILIDLLELERVLIMTPLTLGRQWTTEIEKWSVNDLEIWRATANDREPGPDGITIANHEVIQELVVRTEDGVVLDPAELIIGQDEDDEDVFLGRGPTAIRDWINAGPHKEDVKGNKVPIRERITRLRRDYIDAEWDLIVCDESVMIKNRRALKQGILKTLRKSIPDVFMLLLSGSPTTKYDDDLYAQMEILLPRAFTSYWRFAEFFCIVDTEGWGWTIEGNREDRDVHDYLRDLIYRRSEEDIDVEIPPYQIEELPLDATARQRKALDQMIEDWMVELESEPDERVEAANWLSRTTRLSQITSNLGALPKPSGKGFYGADGVKLDALLDLIGNDDIEFPLLVWSWFKETSAIITKALDKKGLDVVAVTGESKDKITPIEEYKQDKHDVLVLQLGVGRYGHTLMNSRTVFYHDRTFDSDAMYQSLFRARALGQKHSPRLIVPKIVNSADELIDANMEGKFRSIADMTNMNLAKILETLRSDS